MMLNKLPPVFVIGFIPGENKKDKQTIPSYDIDFQIDLSPFIIEVNI
jgi:hypothetical protein